MRNKKEMWKKYQLILKTGKADKKQKFFLKRKKAAVENNHTSRAKRQRVEFAKELENITAMDDLLHI